MVPRSIRAIDFHTTRTINDFMPLASYLRNERPDALVANLSHNNVIALLAKVMTRVVTRVYICQHNALSQECNSAAPLDYRIIPKVYQYLAQSAERIIAVSKGVADDLARTCHIEPKRITTIYNPVIGPDFADKVIEPIDHPWLDRSEPLFVIATQLANHKGHETLLRALKRVPRGRLLILGAGYKRKQLEALTEKLALNERVAFLGFVANPLPYIRAASALVLASTYEGFGNGIVEALGCGTPVIATDCPYGPAEILADGRYGTLVPVGDEAALVAAMMELRSWDPAELRERAEQFTVDRAAQQYFALLTES
jgi:glycosyltransferase involved in cell wall biosynthesis